MSGDRQAASDVGQDRGPWYEVRWLLVIPVLFAILAVVGNLGRAVPVVVLGEPGAFGAFSSMAQGQIAWQSDGPPRYYVEAGYEAMLVLSVVNDGPTDIVVEDVLGTDPELCGFEVIEVHSQRGVTGTAWWLGGPLGDGQRIGAGSREVFWVLGEAAGRGGTPCEGLPGAEMQLSSLQLRIRVGAHEAIVVDAPLGYTAIITGQVEKAIREAQDGGAEASFHETSPQRQATWPWGEPA